VQAESPNGTTIPADGAVIIDGSGARWTVTDGVVRRNGVDTVSSNVRTLLYYGGVVYQSNASGGWWKWVSDGWQDSFDPRVSTSTPSPSPAPGPAPAPSAGVPNIANVARHPADMLEVGPYWIQDNRWGQGGISEGTASYQYQQSLERSLTLTPAGACAARIKWSWPEFNQQGQKIDGNGAYSEVKGYPSIIYGTAPGDSGPDQWPAYMYAVRAPDGVTVPSPPSNAPQDVSRNWQPQGGSVIRRVPCGKSPSATLVPKRLGMAPGSIVGDFKWSKANATGKGHLSWDIWLQETTDQGFGFPNSSVTHEIMIPMGNWGTYGRHPDGRYSGWYSHDTVIDGVTYHVYMAGAGYTFGGLAGKFTNEETGKPRTGWKFIVFQHDGDNHPKGPDGNIHLDFPKFFAHAAQSKWNGVPMVRGTEYCTNIQLGVEMVYGAGDLTIYDFNITGK